MGIYLNPDNENFKATLSDKIYVDKSLMLEELNGILNSPSEKYICVARPRRFGKTITQNMIAAYYSKGTNSKEIFAKLKISNSKNFEEHLNKYNVIKIDMNSEYRNCDDKENILKFLKEDILDEFKVQCPDCNIKDRDSIAQCILKVYTQTKQQFIILMDEYDVLVRESVNGKVNEQFFEEYMNFLNGLFKSDTLKPAIALAYLTGILPVVRDKVQSKLNNFREYTMLDAYKLSEYIGFTQDEVKQLCQQYDVDFEECKRWYDGYYQNGFEIYNPESVVQTMLSKKFTNYWSKTSTYQVISDRLKNNFDGLKDDIIKMLSGNSVDVNVTMFLNTVTDFNVKDDVLTYLIHLGYLVYDFESRTCRIPNMEIRDEWKNAVTISAEYEITSKIIKNSKELLEKTIQEDESAVAESLDMSHIHVSSNKSYNNEDIFQSAIYLSYIYALNKYTVIKEMTTGKGFADVVFIPFVPNLPAMIIELKHNKSSETALNQIKEKKYFSSLEKYSGDLLFVGINYDEQTKKHECKIEKFLKD